MKHNSNQQGENGIKETLSTQQKSRNGQKQKPNKKSSVKKKRKKMAEGSEKKSQLM